MLSNAYVLAKFRFDTAENEHAKNLQNLQIPTVLSRQPAALRDMLTEHFIAGVSVLQVGKPKDGSSVGRSPLYWSRGAAGPQHAE